MRFEEFFGWLRRTMRSIPVDDYPIVIKVGNKTYTPSNVDVQDGHVVVEVEDYTK